MTVYKIGDRVRLKNSGGFSCYRAGMTGTIVGNQDGRCLRVRVDNCTKHPEGLNFFTCEIAKIVEPAAPTSNTIHLTYQEVKYKDKMEVMRNSSSTDDLYFRNSTPSGVGIVLTREQALDLAKNIQRFYNVA